MTESMPITPLAEPFPLHSKRVWVAGHRGMVGSALMRRLAREHCEALSVDRRECDLRRQEQVEAWLGRVRPEVVIVAAATVGGILANSVRPAEFLYDNLMIEANVIHGALMIGVQKLLLLGSSCIYPKFAPQPIPEECLLEGMLEPTNQWYAVAKIAGVKLCQAYRRQYKCDFISVMPTNLYGPGDNFDPLSGHVVPALLRKMHEAKVEGAAAVEIWGTGRPRREFLHVDDVADSCVHLLKSYSGDLHINVGSGKDLTIAELAELIRRVVGFKGRLCYDPERPDGTPRKLLDISRLEVLGWRPKIPLEEGLQDTYRWYLEHVVATQPKDPRSVEPNLRPWRP
jgi:GDP-L-fucose synthase